MRNRENFSIEEETVKEEIEETKEAEQKEEIQPEFKKDIDALEEQEQRIDNQIKDSGYKGILTRLSEKGRSFAGVSMLTLASFGAAFGAEAKTPAKEKTEAGKVLLLEGSELDKYESEISELEEPAGAQDRHAEWKTIESFKYFIKNCNIASLGDGSFAVDMPIADPGGPVLVDVGERPCYRVTPEDMAEVEKIKQEHFQRINFALSKKPFSARMVAEGIRDRTERSLKRVIRYCEKILPGQLPEEIKKAREREQEETNRRKEMILRLAGKGAAEKAEPKTEEEAKAPEIPEHIKKLDADIEKYNKLVEIQKKAGRNEMLSQEERMFLSEMEKERMEKRKKVEEGYLDIYKQHGKSK